MRKFIVSFFMVLSMDLLWNGRNLEVNAASNPYVHRDSITVGKVKYETKYIKDKKYKKQDMNYSIYNLIQRKNGKEKIIEKNIIGKFVSDKKVIYYSKIESKKNVIYKYNLKTKKKRKILSESKIDVFQCSGKYLYIGKLNNGYNDIGTYADIYSYKLKDKKKTHMAKDIGVVKYYKGRVLLLGGKSDVSNSAVYLCKENGKKIKRLPSSLETGFKTKKIYCTIGKIDKNYELMYKVVRYSMNGKKEKTVVKWTKNADKIEKYWMLNY